MITIDRADVLVDLRHKAIEVSRPPGRDGLVSRVSPCV